MENYYKIMIESLEKKSGFLSLISEKCEKQNALFLEENPDLKEFETLVKDKAQLIAQIEKLDKGFEALYSQLKTFIQSTKGTHSEDIRRIQDLIKKVTDQGVAIQVQESRTKALIEAYYSKRRVVTQRPARMPQNRNVADLYKNQAVNNKLGLMIDNQEKK